MSNICHCTRRFQSQKVAIALELSYAKSHFLDKCRDNSTENEVEQGKLNTAPTTQYQLFVIHDVLRLAGLFIPSLNFFAIWDTTCVLLALEM
jgi:hypothetical protein